MRTKNRGAPCKSAAAPSRFIRGSLVALVAVFVMATMTYAQATGIDLQTLPILPTAWFPFAFIAVLAVMIVAGIVYSLSGIISSSEAKNWSRTQIYEGLLSIILLLIFLAFVWVFSQNPWQAYSSAGLTAPAGTIYSCESVGDLFQLATCNLAEFNQLGLGLFQSMFFFSTVAGFAPGFSLSMNYSPPGLNTQLSGSLSLDSILPVSVEDVMGNVFTAMILVFILNQIQLLLLSGSVLWLSFFITLGILARSLGFSRSFGGAMIAVGLGLGLVLPLMCSITYGYIDYQISIPTPLTSAGMTTYFVEYGVTLATGYFLSGGAIAPLPAGPWLFQMTLLGAGLTFLPFINFTIVDAFIVDFSSAIGERLDFMSMLSGVI